MNIGEVLIIQKENPYHDWVLRDIARDKKLKIRRLKWTEKDIRRCRYSGLVDDKEIVWIQVGVLTPSIRNEIQRMKLRKRLVVFEVEKREQRAWLQKIEVEGNMPTALPPVITWQEKEKECLKMIGKFGIQCKTVEVKKKLVGMMIRDPECWSDVRLSAEIARRNGDEIDMAMLQDMFPSMDFYRLDDWIGEVITGHKKKKSLKVAYYFRHEKGYANPWLLNKIREKVDMLGVVYDAYRKGIIYQDITDTNILERSKTVGWELGDTLANIQASDRRWCLRLIEEVPYTYFVKVQKVLFAGDEFVTEDWDIYRYIEELRNERGRYDARYGYTPRKKWGSKKG